MTEKMPAYIAFQGGGALGMAHLGVWKALSEEFDIRGVAGTSAGSIVAAFCAARFSPEDTIDIFNRVDWSTLVKRQNLLKWIIKPDGFSDGKNFHKWLRNYLKKNIKNEGHDITFDDLYKKTNIYLAIVACDLNKKSHVVFDKDTRPNDFVSFAVRASISIPGYFTPMEMPNTGEMLVDGGLLLNYPIELLYEQAQKANCALIGVRFKEQQNFLESPTVWQISWASLQAMQQAGNVPPDKITKYPNYIEIAIDVQSFDFLNFKLAKSEKEELVELGTQATKFALDEYQKKRGQPVGSFQQISMITHLSESMNNEKLKVQLSPNNDSLRLQFQKRLEDKQKKFLNEQELNEQETQFVKNSIDEKRKHEDELTQNRINELTPLANYRFRDHEELEALTHILKAGKLLQKLTRENSPHLSRETRLNTQLILRQILSKVEEKNRFMLQSRSAHTIDFSRDGQIIATVDKSGMVKLFDPEGKQINPRQMNGDVLMKIFDVPNGEMITLRGGSKYLYLLTPDGTLRFLNLYLSPDGGMFAQTRNLGEGKVTLYSLDSAEPKTLTGYPEDTIMTVAFSPDGQVIAAGGWKGWLSLWNRDGQVITGQGTGGDSLNAIDFSPNGEMLATGSNDGKVRLWKPDGTPLNEFQAHSDAIWGLCFSSNGEMLATGSNDRTVKLWKPDGTQVKTLEGHKGVVRAVAFNPNDSQNLASASDDGSVKIWNLGGTGLKILARHEDSVSTVRFSPDGQTILTTSGHGKVSFWRTDGTLFKQESWHNGPISTLDFSPNGKMIVTASGDKEVQLHNSDGDFIANIKQWDGSEWDGIEVLGVSFSPNNQVIALADQQGSVKLYNLSDGTFTTLRDGSSDPSPVWAVKFSPNGNILASAHHQGVVALWQLDGTLLNILPRDQKDTTFTKTGGVYYNSVIGIDFSRPNGDLIASAHIDGTVKLWKLDGSSDEPLILGEPSSNILVRSLRFSPKGDLIASAYTDGTVKLWNLNGSLHKILEGHKSGVTAVDFSPNGNTLASASEDKTVILWDLERSQDLDGLLQRGCEWAEGYLTNNPNITNEDRQIILNINKNP